MPSPACHRSARSRTPRTLSPLCGPAARSAASSSIDANWPACVAYGPNPSVLPPTCPTRRPQRISDVRASACCRLSLLLAALVTAATPLVAVLPDAVWGRFVQPRAIRLRRRAADGRDTPLGLHGQTVGGRRAHVRLRLVTRNRAARIRERRLTISSLRASLRLPRLTDGGLGAHVGAGGGAAAVRGGRFAVATEGELAVSSLLGLNRLLCLLSLSDLGSGRPAPAAATRPLPGAGRRAIGRAVALRAARRRPGAVRRTVGRCRTPLRALGLVRRCHVARMRGRRATALSAAPGAALAVAPRALAVTGRYVVDGLERDHHATPVAVLAGHGERLEQARTDPLAGHLNQAERGDLGHLVLGPVPGQALEQPPQHQIAVALQDHVDEVDHDDAADVPDPKLPDDLLGGLQGVPGDRLLQVAALAGELAGVDVDDGHRLGVVDHQRPA